MESSSVKLILILFVIGFTVQSCAEDEELFDLPDSTVLNGDNENDNDNSGNNGGDLSALGNEVVHDWTELMLQVERYAAGMRPNATARALAYIYLAAYETAVPDMRDFSSNEQHLRGLDIRSNERAQNIDTEVALNACFAQVLDHFLINVPSAWKNRIYEMEDEQEALLSTTLSDEVVENSKEWGKYIAEKVVAYSQTDAAAEEQILDPQPRSYEPPTGAGFWTYSADPERALFPYWGAVRTFVVAPNETSTVAPIPYSENSNSDYFEQMMEVYNVNNTAQEEDNDQLWVAEFWSDDVEGLMFSPPARQYAIANQLIQQHQLNLEETLGLYLKLGFSLNDAAVATWKYKYDYMVMRPNVFIHEFIDPDFQTNLYRLIYWPNPSFPGYPSGHSCFASAAAGLFIDQFGNQTNFTDRSHEGRTEFRGAPRSFSSFEQLAEENAFSRVPLGVHIRMDCTEGLRLGYEIADAINDLDIRKNPG